jgi:hypothetical protein
VYCGSGPQCARDSRHLCSEEPDEYIGRVEAALIGGAEHAGEDLLTGRAAAGAIAAAARFAGDDGWPQRMLGAPIGGVERRVEEKLKTAGNSFVRCC